MFLPQYNPYHRSEGDVAGEVVVGVILWSLMIMLGIFLICAWCTKMVLQHLVNPYLNGALDRDDGLVVVCSTIIWAVIGLALTIPSIVTEPSLALSLITVGIIQGAAWGAGIGAFLVVALWLEVDERWEPTHGFETITNLPGEHYRPAGLDQSAEPEPTLDEVEAMLWNDDIESLNSEEDLFTVPVSSNNSREAEVASG